MPWCVVVSLVLKARRIGIAHMIFRESVSGILMNDDGDQAVQASIRYVQIQIVSRNRQQNQIVSGDTVFRPIRSHVAFSRRSRKFRETSMQTAENGTLTRLSCVVEGCLRHL
jgi:hypothetical protein